VAHLRKSMAHDRVRHAYLFVGPAAIGKTTLARAFAQALNCEGAQPPCGECRPCRLIARDAHPDVPVIEAEQEGGTLKIDQVRALQGALVLRPVEAHYRVPLILRFHEATAQAQDALLKTLEEPPSYAVILLTAEQADVLLPTIVSRCQVLTLRPLGLTQTVDALRGRFGVPDTQAQLLGRVSGGRLGWAVRAAEDAALLDARTEALDRFEALLRADRVARFRYADGAARHASALREMLTFWQTYCRDLLLLASGSDVPVVNADRLDALRTLARSLDTKAAAGALAAVGETLACLARNANTRLALEVLLLDLPQV
jgi:DNA polymerase-3 subunit delta'